VAQKTYESVVCPGCSCLCDDIDLVVEDNRVVSLSNICTWGITKFVMGKKFRHQEQRSRLRRPLVRGNGGPREVSYRVAIRKAAEVLARAKRVLVYGLTHCSYACQEQGVALARRLHARLAPADEGLLYHYSRAFEQHGRFLVTLEEIRDRADLLVFWGANPIHSCPRLVARYAIFARGHFTERGFEDRRAFSVDLGRTEMDTLSQMVILPEGRDLECLEALEQLLAGEKPPSYRGKLKELRGLVAALEAASFGVIFCGRGILYSGQTDRVLTGLFGLSRRVEGRLPLVPMPMATDYNASGFYQVLLRGDGLGGEPELLTTDLLTWDFTEVDAILSVGGDLLWFLSEQQQRLLTEREIPIVSISAFADRTTAAARIALPTAVAGVESEGIAYRMDGLPLVLHKVVDSPYPGDHEILARIGAYL
jgi:formylmethanofuran dehydrogenase subunit B